MWEPIDQQRVTHRAENEKSTETIHAAEAKTVQAHAEAVAELVPQAVEDGATYLATVAAESAALERLATFGQVRATPSAAGAPCRDQAHPHGTRAGA